MTNNYLAIVEHLESCLAKHGDTAQGQDWPNERDALTRYRVMLEVIREPSGAGISLLDFGCGTSRMYDYMIEKGLAHIEYIGLDISAKYLEFAKRKHPDTSYHCVDILHEPSRVPDADYIVMNGVFTEKCSLSYEEMLDYFQQMLCKVFEKARVAIAFNVISKHVDWERQDLFHVPFDTLATILKQNLTRNFVFRSDYGLFEYTTYVYK